MNDPTNDDYTDAEYEAALHEKKMELLTDFDIREALVEGLTDGDLALIRTSMIERLNLKATIGEIVLMRLDKYLSGMAEGEL